ncbi:multicopper oxidase [Demequina sediminis]|uniref:multicopper oxidase domain-containing protein n=1 Tax=Demequina sediminis TaxID=1930058 RepID=UPI0025724863|nr:multicopper oxidase domain-containing protein [Demequina sediminis]BDZ60785.1 multicopper oxidase [Demequina sediminis]
MRARWHLRANALVAAWLVAAAVAAAAHRVLPASEWLMVHLLMLGGVSAAILVWSAHFAEALRRRSLPTGRRGQVARLAAHTVGAVAVIAGMVAPSPRAVVAGGAVVGIAVAWHAVEIALAARGALSNRLGWSTWAYVAAGASLVGGVVCGVLLARGPATDAIAARLYLAHVTLMILGWVGLTVMATLITLWPTVLAVRIPEGGVRFGRAGLVLMGSGVVLSGAALVVGARVAYAAAVLVVTAGIALSAVPMLRAASPRVSGSRVPGTVAAWHLAASVTWMASATLTWAAFVATAGDWEESRQRMGGVVAALVAGGAAQVLLGALTHLLPMVLGGGPHAVRAARDAVERRALARFVLLNGGVALWVLPTPSLVRVAGSMFALAAAVWTLAAIGRAVRVSFRTRREAPADGNPRIVPVQMAAQLPTVRGRGAALVAACALLLGTAAAVAADPASAGVGESAAAEVTATGRTVEVRVEARDMRFTPSIIEIEAGDRLVIEVVNTDTTSHDLVLDSGQASGRIAPGESAVLDVGVVGRSLDGWCSIAGHRQMGMTLAVVVTGGDDAPVAEATAAPTPSGVHGEGEHATIDLQAPMSGSPFDATLEPAPDATVHRVTLEVENVMTEVAPGVTQELWTFGGGVPAPTLRGKVGDVFEVTLVNNGDMGHSIDFHASWIAPDDVMRTIEPGESLTYRFVAERAGAWMYHCSTMPMSLHIANGMAGAVIIDPPTWSPWTASMCSCSPSTTWAIRAASPTRTRSRRRRPTWWSSTATRRNTRTTRSRQRWASACACGSWMWGPTGRVPFTWSVRSSTPCTSRARTSWVAPGIPAPPVARRRSRSSRARADLSS